MLSYRVTGLTPDTFYIIAIQGEIDRYNKTYTTNREEIFCSTGKMNCAYAVRYGSLFSFVSISHLNNAD